MFMQQWNPLISLLQLRCQHLTPPVSKLQPPCFLKFQRFASCKNDISLEVAAQCAEVPPRLSMASKLRGFGKNGIFGDLLVTFL